MMIPPKRLTLQNLHDGGLAINTRVPKMPLHVLAYDVILGLIEAGELKEGERLPTEPVLAQLLAVARSTVRMALLLLQEDGYITTVQGKGTFVLSRRASEPRGNEGYPFFAQDIISQAGKRYACSHQRYVLADYERFLEDKLSIGEGDRVGLLCQTHCADGVPAVLTQDFFIARGVFLNETQDAGELSRSFEQWVREEADFVRTAFTPTRSSACGNQLAPGAHMLLLASHDVCKNDRVMVFSKHYINTSVIGFTARQPWPKGQ